MAENNSRAVLKFNQGEAQKVLKLNYSVGRSVDVSGRVSSDPSNVTFNKSHEEGTLITLNWENGYVIQHVVDFDAVSDTNMVINFVISAEKITYGNSTHDAGWMVS